MPVTATPLESVLVIRYQTGVTTGGSPILRQKSLTGIKQTATDQDVYEVAAALSGLGQYPLVEMHRENNFELINE
ncbi:MAG: DUF1659 domain-containing protein [Peptococcaceae bacterium]|nr:DUF1659 domain-containing protein [Peptococcaceae bacterium]